MSVKTQRKTNHAESVSYKVKSTRKIRGTAPKTISKPNGKHPLSAYEHLHIGVVQTSLDGKYIDVNEEFSRILGYSKEELLQLGVKQCTHEDDYALDIKLLEQLIQGKIPFYGLEKRYIRKDGQIVWVELTRSLVRDEKGKPLHTMGVVIDISEYKQVERVLRESAENFRIATEAARMFKWELDFQKQIFTFADNFIQVLGFSAGLLPQNSVETVWRLSPREDVHALSAAIDKALKDHRDLNSLQYRMINPEDGQTVWLEVNAKVVYDEKGNPRRMFGVAQNITEAKQAEEEIRILSRLPEENPNPVMRLTAEGAVLYANKPSQGLLEVWKQQTDRSIPDELKENIAEAFASGTKKEIEIAQNGKTFSFTVAPIREAGYVNLYGNDITERKRVEEKLHRQAETLDLAHVVIRALDNRIVSWSKGVEQLYGWTKEEALGRVSHELFQTKLPVPLGDLQEKLFVYGEWEGELEQVKRDGTRLTVLSHQVLQRDAAGKPIAILENNIDVTESKQIEQKLAHEQELLKRFFETMPVMVSMYDPATNSSQLNTQFEQTIGWKNGELSVEALEQALYPDPDYLQQVVQRMAAAAPDEWVDVKVQTRDGRMLDTLWANVSIPSGRQIGMGIDITERKQTERVLAEFARQQEALYQLSDRLHHTNSLEEVYNAALDAILSALQCERASILLFDDTGVMKFVAWRGLSDRYRKATEGHSPWGPGEKNPYPICVGDVRASDLSDWLKATIEEEGIHSLAFIPLLSNGKLIGKFMVYFDALHECSDTEIELSLMIARQLAFGIDRKRAEIQLRESEQRYRTIVDTANEGVWYIDLNATTIYLNEPMARILDYSPEEVIGRKVPEFCFEEDMPKAQRRIASNYQGSYENFDFRFRRRDGSEVLVLASTSPVRDAEGKIIGALGMFVDVTARKRIEAALQREQELLNRIFESIPVMLTIYDPSTHLLRLNKQFEQLVGWSHEETAGVSLMEACYPDPDYREKVRQFMDRGAENEWMDIQMRTRDGRILETSWSNIHLSNEMRVGIGIDISERKQAEEKLRASEGLYRAIARSIPGGGVYVVDRDFRYLVAEGPVTEAFGLSRKMLEGRAVWEAFPDERGKRMKERLQRTFAGETVNFETEDKGHVYWTQQAPLRDSIGQAIIVTIDITERKRAEEALKQSEERFARFMEHLPGLAWIKDQQGRYVYANATAEKAFGAPREKLYGKTDLEIFSPEVAEQFRKNDEQALVPEKGMQTIETLPQGDGIVHYSLVTKFPIPVPNEDTALIGGTAFDITERLQAEEALRESEERFRAILKQATAGIVRKDAEGRFIFVNGAFCNMLGYSEAELLGKTVWEFMHPDDIAENKRSFERLMGQSLPFKLERRFLRKDGSVIWVDASVAPVVDAEGKAQSAVAVEVDITGRRHAEEALQQLNLQLESRVQKRTATIQAMNQSLREEIAERKRVEEALRLSEATARASEEKLRTLFDLLPVGISFLDPEGNVIETNSALLNIVRLSREQLLSETYKSRRYIRADGTLMPSTEFAGLRALAEAKTIYNVETGILLENGDVVWTSVSAAPVDVEDVGVVVVTVDITDSKRAERALQESHGRLRILSQRLVEVQEEERRALARELHDRVGQTLAALNINLIIINSQLSAEAAQQIGARLSDSMKLVAETIALVRDVMTDLRPAVLDDYGLEAALEAHINAYQSRYNIQVEFEKPAQPIPRLGPSAEMTLLRIAQEALMNIAKHAHAEHINLSLRRDGGSICLTIRDNGIGIDSWQDANRPGSHGLTIMRERAEAFGGTLKIKSVPGQGTSVDVSIPYRKSEGQENARKEQSL